MLFFFFSNRKMLYFFFFFFSSRRRHTRSLCDWSSDVCSSDLGLRDEEGPARAKHTPHFCKCSPLRVRRKVMQEQARNDHIEAVARQAQGFSGTQLELTAPGLCGPLARVADHFWRRVHANHQSMVADRPSQQARKVAG